MLKLWRKVGSIGARTKDSGARVSKKKPKDMAGKAPDEPAKPRNELKDILEGLIDKLFKKLDKLTKKLGKLPNKMRHWIRGLLDGLSKWLANWLGRT